MSSGITPVAAPKRPPGRSLREGNADGETGVRVAARAHGVGQQQAVEPAVDHAVARAQGRRRGC